MGYGRCPNCGAIDAPDSARERRPLGRTRCGACQRWFTYWEWERTNPRCAMAPHCPNCKEEMARLRRLMGEAVRDFHGRGVLFGAEFLDAADTPGDGGG